MNQKDFDVVVVGGGASGVMAFLRCALNYDRVLLVQGSPQTQKRSRGAWVHEVDNIPGWQGIIHPVNKINSTTLQWLEGQTQLKSEALKGEVTKISGSEGSFELEVSAKTENHKLRSKYVILATGVMDIQPTIGGAMDPFFPYANKGFLIYCMRCDGHRLIGHKVSIFGHSDSSIHIATILKERYELKDLSILTNGKRGEFSEEKLAMAKKLGISIMEEELVGIEGDPKGAGLGAYLLAGGKKVATDRSVVSLGIKAYNDLLVGLNGQVDSSGQAIVSEKMESSISGLFVVGDLAAGHKMQIYTGWDDAVDAADEINHRLRKARR